MSNRPDLKARWQEWHRAWGLSPDDFCWDGPLPGYSSAKRRVVFVLRDSNDFTGDLCDWMKDGPRHLMWRNVAAWAGGILSDFPEFAVVAPDEARRTSWNQVAIMNLKKAKGGSSSDPTSVHLFAHHDRALLREQLADLSPQLIVSCGVEQPLIWLMDLDLGPRWERPLFRVSEEGPWLLAWRHPARLPDIAGDYGKMAAVFRGVQVWPEAEVPPA